MSTYYQYQDVKRMIAHKLMKIEGWKVYGYHADESDSMTDYYSPAYWRGIAEKNGYILCVDISSAAGKEEVRKYNYNNFTYDKAILDKIEKLQQMTIERGASEQEAESAKRMIIRLREKAESANDNREKYTVVDVIPAHMANPSHCNWHIEKDGHIIAKGNGLLKYSSVYYEVEGYRKNDIDEYRKDKAKYMRNEINDIMEEHYYNYTWEKAAEVANDRVAELEKKVKLIEGFEKLINRFDTECGGIIGKGDGKIYQKVKVIEYKDEMKVFEKEDGKIEDGQCFILKANFNYGCSKGFVYRIHKVYSQKLDEFIYHAYKLNGKLRKECTGSANKSNYWFIGSGSQLDKFYGWVDKGYIAFCDLKEVKVPHEVEKVVKRKVNAYKGNRSDDDVMGNMDNMDNMDDVKESVSA